MGDKHLWTVKIISNRRDDRPARGPATEDGKNFTEGNGGNEEGKRAENGGPRTEFVGVAVRT